MSAIMTAVCAMLVFIIHLILYLFNINSAVLSCDVEGRTSRKRESGATSTSFVLSHPCVELTIILVEVILVVGATQTVSRMGLLHRMQRNHERQIELRKRRLLLHKKGVEVEVVEEVYQRYLSVLK